MVGFIRDGWAEANARYAAAFGKGLNETGTVEGQNVTVEYHWLEGKHDRLPTLADLVRRQVAVIAATGSVPTLAAKAATATIPIVFGVGEDPVRLGIVASFARPGNFPAANSCIWPRSLPRCRPCRGSRGRKPIRRGRCAGSSAFAPGGATDIISRLLGQWLSDRLGQQFVIDNRPGGGGNIGAEAVARASPDGYTLLMVGAFQRSQRDTLRKAQFQFDPRHRPVASVVRAAHCMVVNPSVPAKTVPEFIAYAKANPGKLTTASAGIGLLPISRASCSR